MARLLAVPALILALAATPAVPAPQLPDRQPWYFPTAVGTRWVYQDADLVDSTPGGWEESVIASEDDGDSHRVTIESSAFGGLLLVRRTVLVSGTGMAESIDDRARPVWWLRGTVRPGAKWQDEEPYRPYPLKRAAYIVAVDRRVGAVEWVTVPAGRFQAARVESAFTWEGEIIRTSHWFAPGVGLVKKDDGKIVTVLRSFTPGRK